MYLSVWHYFSFLCSVGGCVGERRRGGLIVFAFFLWCLSRAVGSPGRAKMKAASTASCPGKTIPWWLTSLRLYLSKLPAELWLKGCLDFSFFLSLYRFLNTRGRRALFIVMIIIIIIIEFACSCFLARMGLGSPPCIPRTPPPHLLFLSFFRYSSCCCCLFFRSE